MDLALNNLKKLICHENQNLQIKLEKCPNHNLKKNSLQIDYIFL